MVTETAVAAQGERAGFGVRVVACIIDGIILLIPGIILSLILPELVQFVVSVAIAVAYDAYFWTTTGATPGKMVMGLKVVSAQTGELLDPGTAILRYVGYWVSAIPIGLGFLWVIWDPDKEGWHDKIAKTMVIKSK